MSTKAPYYLRVFAFFSRWLFPAFDFCVHGIFGFIACFKQRHVLPPITDRILLYSATQLVDKIRKKQLKSVDVVRAYIERLKAVQPALNAVVDERYEAALQEAEKSDQEIAASLDLDQLFAEKPLLGVPFTTKDAIAVKGLHQDAGLYSRRNFIADFDAGVISVLRNAGAIPLCITNVPVYCLWSESSNRIYGITNNPYDTRRTCGGSSGGEGSILGAGASAFGIGSDIGGSIRTPAVNCGIFGHKPSSHLVPTSGHFPYLSDTIRPACVIGPMCRYAEDLKTIMKVVAKDKLSQLQLDKPVEWKKIQVYYMEENGDALSSPVDLEIKMTVCKVANLLSAKTDLPPKRLSLEEFKESAMIYTSTMHSTPGMCLTKSMGAYNKELRLPSEWTMWFLGCSKFTFPALFICSLYKYLVPKPTSKTVTNFVQKGEELKQQLREILGNNGILVCPAQPTVALFHHETVLKTANVGYPGIFNCVDCPATACTIGLGSSGLPLSVQVVANAYHDRLCLAAAEEIESEFGGWVPPCDLDLAPN